MEEDFIMWNEEDNDEEEDEVDETELEVALYSQIHFDPVTPDSFAHTTKEFQPNFVNPSFQVGVRSFVSKRLKKPLAKRESEKKMKPALLNLDFISFSDTKSNEKDVKDTPVQNKSKECSQDQTELPQSISEKLPKDDRKEDVICINDSQSSDINQSSNEKKQKEDVICINDSLSSDINQSSNEKKQKEDVICIDDSLSSDINQSSNEKKQKEDVICIDDSLSSDINQSSNEKKQDTVDVWDECDDEDDVHLLAAVMAVDESPEKYASTTTTTAKNSLPQRKEEISRLNEKTLVDNKKKLDANSRLGAGDACNVECVDISEETAIVDLLRFSITKGLKKDSNPPSPATEEQKVNVEVEVKNVKKGTKRTATKQPKKDNTPAKLEEFLKLTTAKSNVDSVVPSKKKKKISKQEAAIQLRKPPVVLRRPATVVVKYHQDSDTNTDYSESEESNIDSPVKARKHQGDVPAQPSKTTKKLDVTEGQESSSDSSSSDEDGEVSEENIVANVVAVSKEEDGVEEEIESSGSENEVEEEMGDKENRSIEEEDPSDSENEVENSSELSSDEDNFDLDAEPTPELGLDFNLAGGMGNLLKTPDKDKDDAADKWTIDAQDKSGSRKPLYRYFIPNTAKCRNCKKEGHLAVSCTEKNTTVCIMCGTQGHYFTKCPDAACYNCLAPGHRSAECPKPKQNWYQKCERCWMQGHAKDDCPDLWRQFHLTIGLDRKRVVKSRDKGNSKISCFNCGRKGHLGYECHNERMNRFEKPYYPFIAEYDRNKTKDIINPHSDRRDKDKEKKRERNHDVDRKRKSREKSDSRDRKARKRNASPDSDDCSKIESFNIQIEQRQSPSSHKESNKRVVSRTKDSHRTEKTRDRDYRTDNAFVSGNTVFRYQEPSDPRFSHRTEDSIPPEDGSSYQYQEGAADQYSSYDNDRYHSKDFLDESNDSPSDRGRRKARNKSRKAKQQERRAEIEDGEIMEDLSQHQAFNNEWWKSRAEQEQGDDMFDEMFDLTDSETADPSARRYKRGKRGEKRKKPRSSSSDLHESQFNVHKPSKSKKVKDRHSSRHPPSHEINDDHPGSSHHHHQQQHRQGRFNQSGEDYISLNSNNNNKRSRSRSSSKKDYISLNNFTDPRSFDEDYISLSSKSPRSRSSGNKRSRGSNHSRGRGRGGGGKPYDRNIGKNGFKARGWVMAMY